MAASNTSGPYLFRPDSDLIGAPFEGLPLELLSQLGPDGTSGIQYYFNHFHRWEGPVAEGSAGGWTLSGTTGAATITLGNVREGAIVLTGDGTASVNPTLALGSATTGMNFRYVVGKRLWLAARVKLVTIATTEVFLGYGTSDTSPTVTGTFPADGLFFHKASTETKISFQARQDGTGTDRALIGATLTDDTYTTLALMVDPTGNIHVYQTGVELAASMIPLANANIPDAAGDTLQFIVGIFGASMTMTLDYLLMAQEV